jgi:hypothetical protein
MLYEITSKHKKSCIIPFKFEAFAIPHDGHLEFVGESDVVTLN